MIEGVALVQLRRRHAGPLSDLYTVNREFLAPFSPLADDTFFTEAAQLQRIELMSRRARAGDNYAFAIEVAGEVAGTLTISDIVRGSFQSAHLGYWVSRHLNGRGVATDSVQQAVRIAFGSLGLHRLQAATLVHNIGSQRVLEKNGFERIGVSHAYLRIAGRWQDHVLFALVAGEQR